MLEIESPQPAKLQSVNVRSEQHGKDLVPAVDLKFTLDACNDVLSHFHGSLKSFLYQKTEASSTDAQPGLDGVEPVSDLPNLRFPKLMPLAWDDEQTGMELVVDYGLGGTSDLVLSGCTVNAVGLAPKEGGTVEVKFRVQCTNLLEATIGKLATLVQHDVHITLSAPEVAQSETV